MVNPSPNPASLPLALVRAMGDSYTDAWASMEHFRAQRGKGDIPDWPRWCYAPIAAGIATTTYGGDLQNWSLDQQIELVKDGAVITALSAWRQTKGVYVFDGALLEALWGTPVTGDLPTSVLKRLPEWCPYLALDRELRPGLYLSGAWVHLEWDPNDGSEELRFVVVIGDGLVALPLDLGGTLREGVESVLSEAMLRARVSTSGATVDDLATELRKVIEPLVSLTLYLCSEQPDITGKGKPGNPKATKVKGGWRTFPAPGPRVWGVGQRIGAALKAASEQPDTERGATETGRARPRPHIRRAHWAVRWTGPRDSEQTPVLRWIAPTLVAGTDEALPATVRKVE